MPTERNNPDLEWDVLGHPQVERDEVVHVFQPKPVPLAGNDTADSGAKGHGAEPDESVQPFALTDWNPWTRTGGPAFPLDMMPPVVRDWIEMRASQTGADISAFALAALQIVGGCVDHRVRLQPKLHEHDYLIGPVLWTMLVGPPSTIKTAVVRSVTNVLRRFDRQDANVRAESVRRAIEAGDEDAEKTEPPSRRRLVSTRPSRPSAKSCRSRIAAPRWCATSFPAGSIAWIGMAEVLTGHSGSKHRTAAITSPTASRANARSRFCQPVYSAASSQKS